MRSLTEEPQTEAASEQKSLRALLILACFEVVAHPGCAIACFEAFSAQDFSPMVTALTQESLLSGLVHGVGDPVQVFFAAVVDCEGYAFRDFVGVELLDGFAERWKGFGRGFDE